MKRDALEAIRLMAVERVRDGERPSSVIASFGFNRTTIYRWLEVASKPRAVQRSIHDAHGEDCTDAAEGDAMPTI